MSGLAATLGTDVHPADLRPADPGPAGLPVAGMPCAGMRPADIRRSARPPAVARIADALAARGAATASWRAGNLHLVMRAAMPVVHEVSCGALLLDGDAAPSTLVGRYLAGGPTALLSGPTPYTMVLADRDRRALVLARNGDGAPLYWARHGPTVLVASEPVALLAAGVPAEPDPEVVRRFLAAGECDEGPATFFAGIVRVLPGQVVEIRQYGTGGASVRVCGSVAAAVVPWGAAAALAAADFSGRTGVRLGCGAGAAAVLGTALTSPDRLRPLPVYSTTFPELGDADRAGSCAAALLGPYALGAARHRTLPVFADEIDVDAYLVDLGEPTPQLADWLRWAVAKRVAGEVDTLVDSGTGRYLSRLADRLTSRFGVSLRLPLQGLPTRHGELAAIAHQLLAPATGFAGAGDEPGTDALLPELLPRLRVDLVTTFLAPRAGRFDPPGSRDGLAEVLALLAGRWRDPAALWRRFLVERWLRTPALRPDPEPGQAPAPSRRAVTAAAEPVAAAGRGWLRLPVRTELLASGDKLAEKLAWYASETIGRRAAGPWFVLLAAKPVAVMQGRARPLWEIRPGLTARLLHRLTDRRHGPATPWALQVAIEEGGWWRSVAATLALALDRPGWYARLAGPTVRAIRRPRPDALPPGQVAVVPAPDAPDRVASDVVAALRTVLAGEAYAGLGGCAVVAGDVIGWAAPPHAQPPPPGLLAALAAGDPFGDDHTPIVLAVPAGPG